MFHVYSPPITIPWYGPLIITVVIVGLSAIIIYFFSKPGGK